MTDIVEQEAQSEIEAWASIPGHPNYEVSSKGRVRSLDRFIERSRGGGAFYRGQILASKSNGTGYMQVQLSTNKKRTIHYVHRLMLEAFVGPPPDGWQTRHFNGRRSENNLGNILWGTHDENEDDKLRHNSIRRGSRHPIAKQKEDVIITIRERYAAGEGLTSIAKSVGYTRQNIFFIVKRKTWNHV